MQNRLTDTWQALTDADFDKVRRTLDTPTGENQGIDPAESAIALAAAVGATFLTRQLIRSTWRTTLDREPPKNPASPTVQWKEALLWGAASGALVGIARIASRRASSGVYRKIRH